MAKEKFHHSNQLTIVLFLFGVRQIGFTLNGRLIDDDWLCFIEIGVFIIFLFFKDFALYLFLYFFSCFKFYFQCFYQFLLNFSEAVGH